MTRAALCLVFTSLTLLGPAQATEAPAELVDQSKGVARDAKRLARVVDKLGPKSGRSQEAKRAEALSAWTEARDAALGVIFDLSVYPSEDHGREGQSTVDAHVDRVRPRWARVDAMIRKDLRAVLKLSPEKAGELLQELRQLQSEVAELEAAYAAASVEPAELPAPGPTALALLSLRAGESTAGEALDAYGQVLLQRLRDELVRADNAAFRRARAVEQGAAPSGDEIEQVRLTNDYRLMMGRPVLRLDPRLVASARGHSADMTRLAFFAHESPVDGKEHFADRIEQEGYDGAGGENIALGSIAPAAAHNAWYHSSGHHRNILSPSWTAMGSGRDGQHWTQNFGY